MALSGVIQDGLLLQFGIDDDVITDVTYGLVQGYTITENVESTKWSDCGGAFGGIQQHGQYDELELNYISLSGDSQPVIGLRFTFDDRSWIVNNISNSKIVDGFSSRRIGAEWYPNALSGGF